MHGEDGDRKHNRLTGGDLGGGLRVWTRRKRERERRQEIAGRQPCASNAFSRTISSFRFDQIACGKGDRW